MSGYSQTNGNDLVQTNYYQQTPINMLRITVNGITTTLGQAIASGGSYLPLSGGTVTGASTFSSASTPLTVPNGIATLGGSTFGGFLRVQAAAGTASTLQLSTNNSARWNIQRTNAAESGNSSGALLEVDAFKDGGTFSGILLQAERTSGGLGLGKPDFTSLAPWTQTAPRATFGGGVVGNYQNFIGATNAQPVATLPANPISTTNLSTTVSVNWPGCAAANGPLSRLQYECWVNLQGVTAVGGITPSGWVNVAATPDANTFTFVWTAAATSTATGGGSSVTAQPSFTTLGNAITSTETTGATGFNLQTEELWNVDPAFFQPTGGAVGGYPKYLQRWHWTCGPNDTSGTNNWSLAGIEWDLTNRGPDNGYSPAVSNQGNYCSGIYMGANTVPSWATGGGAAANWGAVFNVYSTQEQTGIGVYNAFVNQPFSLVGAGRDPSSHGGVAFDAFGALHSLSAAPYTTTIGTSNITVNVPAGFLATMSVGDQVYIGTGYTISGVSWSPGTFAITALDHTNGGFTFQGTGTAAATVSGGGAANVDWYAPEKLVPYAPFQINGAFKHGLIISGQAHLESNGAIETPPGNGILWSDGTGTASINTNEISVGNIGLTITSAGTGLINLATATKIVGNIGFNNTTPIAKPTITGSKGGNAALTSLISALAAYGLVVDNTT